MGQPWPCTKQIFASGFELRRGFGRGESDSPLAQIASCGFINPRPIITSRFPIHSCRRVTSS